MNFFALFVLLILQIVPASALLTRCSTQLQSSTMYHHVRSLQPIWRTIGKITPKRHSHQASKGNYNQIRNIGMSEISVDGTSDLGVGSTAKSLERFKSVPINIYVDGDVRSHLRMRNSDRKARVFLGKDVDIDLPKLSRLVEKHFVALSDQVHYFDPIYPCKQSISVFFCKYIFHDLFQHIIHRINVILCLVYVSNSHIY